MASNGLCTIILDDGTVCMEPEGELVHKSYHGYFTSGRHPWSPCDDPDCDCAPAPKRRNPGDAFGFDADEVE